MAIRKFAPADETGKLPMSALPTIDTLPTPGQKNALAGTSGTPGTGNEYVTTQDARMSNARTPSAHSHAIADTTGLQAALDGKSASNHTHAGSGPTVVKLTANQVSAVTAFATCWSGRTGRPATQAR